MGLHRVAITGIGALTPIGCGVDGLWAGLRRGVSAVRPLSRFDASAFRSRLAAELAGFDAAAHLGPKSARRLDRYSQLAVVAALDAVADAGLDLAAASELQSAAGCCVGSALGGIAFAEEQHRAYLAGGPRAVEPNLALCVFGGAAATNVALHLGLRGPSAANSNSCAAGAFAIGDAFRLVRSGQTPLMLAGGVEAPLAPLTFGSFALIKAMSTRQDDPQRASRPFDAQRDGFVMGEGAAMLVLEDFDSACARGAHVYAELRGFGATNDAHHMLAPLPDGRQAARAISLALRDACLGPADVDYINAHASATPIGDRAEACAIALAFGEHVGRVPVSATKGLYGHPLGASPAIETAISALALERGWLPGTTNLETPDADNPLRLIGPDGQPQTARVAVNNAFGFGGINAALVLQAV